MGKVDKLSICRICLAGKVRMHKVLDQKLKEFYEKLTAVPFDTADCRPSLACYICYAMLHKCYQFNNKCLNTETIFKGMLNQHNQILTYKFQRNIEPFYNLQSLVHVDTFNCYLMEDVVVKEEVSEVEQEDVKSDVDVLHHAHFKNEDTDTELDPDPLATDRSSHIDNSSVSLNIEYTTKPRKILDKFENTDNSLTEHEKNENSLLGVEKSDNSVYEVVISNNSVIEYLDNILVETLDEDVDEIEVEALDENFEYDQQDTNTSEESDKSGTKRHTVNKESEDEDWVLPSRKRKSQSNKNEVNKHLHEINKHNRLKGSLRFRYEVVHTRRTHAGEQPYKCDVCRTLRIRNKPLHIPAQTRYKNCDVCVRGFLEKTSGTYQKCFIEKRFIKHVSNLYRCDKCQRSFSHKAQLMIHINRQACEPRYQCHICPKNYYWKPSLERHIRVHTGEKPYQCDICERNFAQNTHLKRHKLTHTGEKPFMCHVCSQLFNQNGNLQTHLRNVHKIFPKTETTTAQNDTDDERTEMDVIGQRKPVQGEGNITSNV